MSIGNFRLSLSQAILAGIILVGRLGLAWKLAATGVTRLVRLTDRRAKSTATSRVRSTRRNRREPFASSGFCFRQAYDSEHVADRPCTSTPRYTQSGADSPQLIFIHIHQLVRIQWTLFQLDTVNIYWWWCMNYCRVDRTTDGRQVARRG